jgi:DNA-binding CsgD family transcriptional regulator
VTTVEPLGGAEVTAREAEILALIARHLTNAQIADALFISTRTVESHVSAMLRKLQLPDRRSLARHAEAMPGLLVKSGSRGLPVPVTPFIGRTGERAALTAALAEHRLVTATGPGGIGKTRLALSVAAEVAGAALAWSAGEESRRAQAADLAAELAGLLFLRGRQAQAQQRYEQGAVLAARVTERAAFLRLAAGAAASRFVGEDALRLLRMAADAALTAGDRAGAARDLATMAMYINRAPGIMATPHSHAEADALVAEVRALSDDSPLIPAAIAVAMAWADPPGPGEARRVVDLAERAGDGIVHSIALDLLTLTNLVNDDIAEAVRTARRRLELLDTLAVSPLSGFEFGDGHLVAAETALGAGDLAGAAAHAEAIARLPFYRDEDHLAMCRRLLVDALAGHFDDVVRTGERFRTGWERAGRPVARNLARGTYAVAMVHGMRGDDSRRAAWVRLTIDLGTDPEQLAGCLLGWPPVFDGLLALHRNDPARAMQRLAADIDDPEMFSAIASWEYRPWYAALCAEAAVLDRHPNAAGRIERSRHAARDNPIATAIVERAAAITTGDRDTLTRLAFTFARLGCPYQQARTARMAAGPPAQGSG